MELRVTTGVTSRLAEELEYLILNSYSSEYDYYLQLKHVMGRMPANSSDRLHTIIEKLVNKRCFHTQKDVARICEVTGCYPERIKFWESRSKEMLASIKEKYWNEEKECFTSGTI